MWQFNQVTGKWEFVENPTFKKKSEASNYQNIMIMETLLMLEQMKMVIDLYLGYKEKVSTGLEKILKK
jgi:hypothetical protein